MLIDITEAEIRSGVRKSCDRCPVALGITRLTGIPARHIIVCDETIGVLSANGTGWREFPTPPAVRDFIRDFDARKTVGPISFELPDELVSA